MAEFNTICSVEDCNRKRETTYGYCLKHYKRFKRNGDPNLITRAAPNSGISFFDSPMPETDECIIWPYSIADTGYGHVKVNGKAVGAHRHSLMLVNPTDDETLFALHSCDVRKCVNPRHLRWGTQTENVGDTVSRGRTASGEKNGMSRITESDALEILSLSGTKSLTELSEQFGINRNAVRRIIPGERWGYLQKTQTE